MSEKWKETPIPPNLYNTRWKIKAVKDFSFLG